MKIDLPNCRVARTRMTRGGVVFGYNTMAKQLGQALEDIGVMDDPQSPIRLTVPFYPDDDVMAVGKKETWAFTMWEFPELPPDMVEACCQRDFVVVPSPNQVEWFKAAGVTSEVFCCPLGVDDEFVYRDRYYSPLSLNPFVFLWLGVMTWRKMFQHAILGFRKAFGDRSDVVLYFKVSKKDYRTMEGMKGDFGNIFVDKHQLSRLELLDLYYQAHCFFHTSAIEGFGLPPAEAMSTGALVFAPDHGALGSFVNDKTAVVMETEPHKMVVTMEEPYRKIEQTWLGTTVRPDMDGMVRQLRWIVDNYRSTEPIRRRGAELITDRFRWRHAAQRLKALISQHSRRLGDGRDKEDRIYREQSRWNVGCAGS